MKKVTFHVNPDICIRCGLCVGDCLERIIDMQDVPVIAEKDREKCLHCGHCQTIVPLLP